MSTGFDKALGRIRELVAGFRVKDFYTNRWDSLDRQIDALVYDLYGLTADEIKIVEGAAK